MRKIEEDMLRAIQRGKGWKSGNTSYDGDGNVYLYGHHIARNVTKGGFEYTWAGWKTATTASRLRAILRWSTVNEYKEKPYYIGTGNDDSPYAWYKLGE